MTTKNSAGRVLGDLIAAGATAAWKIANVLLGECGLTHAGADLQRFGNFGDGADPCMPQTPVQLQTDVLQTPESRKRKVANCLKKTRIKSKKATLKPILGRINAPRLPNERYQKLQPLAQPESSNACPSPTSCSTAVVATWTSAFDATSTSPMLSTSSTTPSFSDLA